MMYVAIAYGLIVLAIAAKHPPGLGAAVLGGLLTSSILVAVGWGGKLVGGHGADAGELVWGIPLIGIQLAIIGWLLWRARRQRAIR